MSRNMGPDEKVFRAHLEMGPFLSGVARGRWRLLSLQWPCAVVAVSAAARPNGPAEYALRFDLTNYPKDPPTARPWDPERNAPLEDARRPDGRSRVPKAFRTDWMSGSALYLPCDRVAINGHQGWRQQHPHMIWNPNGDITQYLRIVHELLTSSDYTGPRSA